MKKILLLFVVLAAGILLLNVASPSVLAQADASSQEACETLKSLNPDDTGCRAAGGEANSLIKLALNLLSIAAGVIAVIMLIVSGLKYITAQGDPTEISNAKKTLIYAIVGLVVVALAQAIVRFVLARSLSA